MDGIDDVSEREDVVEMLNHSPDEASGSREGKRTSMPLEGAPSWYNGEDDEGYSAQAAMTVMGRVSR
jgi:hypothetical protein